MLLLLFLALLQTEEQQNGIVIVQNLQAGMAGDTSAVRSSSSSNLNQVDKPSLPSVSHVLPPDDHVLSSSDIRGIGVVVRVRPLSTQELANSTLGYCVKCFRDAVIIDGTNASCRTAASQRIGSATKYMKPRRFEVDAVHHQHCTQKQVYEESCRHIVEALFDGINGAILAYGATGSGKTHTMFGGAMSAPGIVYEAVHDIFDVKTLLEEDEGKKVKVKCSFIEIYNENVFDLLAPPRKPNHSGISAGSPSSSMSDSSPLTSTPALLNAAQAKAHSAEDNGEKTGVWVNGRQSLPVLEGGTNFSGAMNNTGKNGEEKFNVEPLLIPGLTYVFPESVEEFSQAIEKGRMNRFVASTAVNAQSSRSHAIITIEIQISGPPPFPGTVARIRMCDLAGSERAASSTNSGIRLREGGSINRSLLALGSVVQSLLQQKRKPNQKTFIPYRGSCLTRLLKDSLGGNCRTQMIFCLNPSTKQLEESVNTMLFAMKAKQVQVQVHRNELSLTSAVIAKNQELLIDELRQQVSYYQEELRRLGVKLEKDIAAKWQAESGVAFTLMKNSIITSPPASSANNKVCIPPPSGSSGSGTGMQYLETARQRRREKNVCIERVEADFASRGDTLFQKGSLFGQDVAGEVNRDGSPLANTPHVSSDAEEAYERVSSTGIPILSVSLRRHSKPDTPVEISPPFSSLQSTLKALMAEKDAQYWKNREAKERIVARDLQLRELKWKLARFLASNELGVRLRGVIPTTIGGTIPTPVGVAGMRKTIADVEAEQTKECDSIQNMLVDLERTDRKMETLQREIPRDTKHQIMVELLFENMKLRQSCTEAEHLAAEYHQECRQARGHIVEYEEALSVCVSALHSVIPHVPHSAKAMADAQLALFYANLPRAETPDMIKVFEASLKADSTPPLAPISNSYPSGNLSGLDFTCPSSSQIYHSVGKKTSNPRDVQQLALRDMKKTFSPSHSVTSRGRPCTIGNRLPIVGHDRDDILPNVFVRSPNSSLSLDLVKDSNQDVPLCREDTAEMKGEDEEEEEPSPLSHPPPLPHPLIHHSYSPGNELSRATSETDNSIDVGKEEMDEFMEDDTIVSSLSSSEGSTSNCESKKELEFIVSEAAKPVASLTREKESATEPLSSLSITPDFKVQSSTGITKNVNQTVKVGSDEVVSVIKKSASKDNQHTQKLGQNRSKTDQTTTLTTTLKSESNTAESGPFETNKGNESGTPSPSLSPQRRREEKNRESSKKSTSSKSGVTAAGPFGQQSAKTLTTEKPAPFTRYYSSFAHFSKNSSSPESSAPSISPMAVVGNSGDGALHSSLPGSSTPSQHQDERHPLFQPKEEGGPKVGCRRRNNGVGIVGRKGNPPSPSTEGKSSEAVGGRTAGASGKTTGGKLMDTASSQPKHGLGPTVIGSLASCTPVTPTRMPKGGGRGGKQQVQESPILVTLSPPQHVESDTDGMFAYARTPSRLALPGGSMARLPLGQEIVKTPFKARGGGPSGGAAIRMLPGKDPVRVYARKREDVSSGSSTPFSASSSPAVPDQDFSSGPPLSSSSPMKGANALALSPLAKVGMMPERSSSGSRETN